MVVFLKSQQPSNAINSNNHSLSMPLNDTNHEAMIKDDISTQDLIITDKKKEKCPLGRLPTCLMQPLQKPWT